MKRKTISDTRITGLRHLAIVRMFRCERAIAMLEFALIFPIFLMFATAVFEVGMIMFGNSVINNVISQTARQAIVGCIDNEKAGQSSNCKGAYRVDPEKLKREIITRSAGLIKPENLLVGADLLENMNLDNPLTCNMNLGQGGEVVVYTAAYDWPVLTPLVHAAVKMPFVNVNGFGQVVQFRTTLMARNEPFGDLGAQRTGQGLCNTSILVQEPPPHTPPGQDPDGPPGQNPDGPPGQQG